MQEHFKRDAKGPNSLTHSPPASTVAQWHSESLGSMQMPGSANESMFYPLLLNDGS